MLWAWGMTERWITEDDYKKAIKALTEARVPMPHYAYFDGIRVELEEQSSTSARMPLESPRKPAGAFLGGESYQGSANE